MFMATHCATFLGPGKKKISGRSIASERASKRGGERERERERARKRERKRVRGRERWERKMCERETRETQHTHTQTRVWHNSIKIHERTISQIP